MIQNKKNSNKKNNNQIWQIKKLMENEVEKKIQFYKSFKIK
jgi:hypothetical protein